jgi:8-hydroxy-5-deazaflavin:NADPH oxidoreductase
MTTYGIIGAGNIGGAIARAVIGLGDDVVIANSRGPETLADLVAELGPKARAATASEAAEAAEVAVVSVPLHAVNDVPAAPLAGKIVIDTNNYYYERDGHIDSLDRGEATTSGLVQQHFAGAKVVKAFNSMSGGDIVGAGTPAGTPGRRALAISSDYPEAALVVTELLDRLGFDTVDVSPLSESWRIERDRPAYGKRLDRAELEAGLAAAPRTI